MIFKVFGPFDVPRTASGKICGRSKDWSDFWTTEVNSSSQGLSHACGCYVFAMKASGGATALPWYVGMTSRSSFAKECVQPHKLSLYKDAQWEYERGRPVLYLLPQLTPNGSFCKPSRNGRRPTEALEELLIGIAFASNPELLNIRGTKYIKELHVPGVINYQGHPGKSALSLKRALGL